MFFYYLQFCWFHSAGRTLLCSFPCEITRSYYFGFYSNVVRIPYRVLLFIVWILRFETNALSGSFFRPSLYKTVSYWFVKKRNGLVLCRTVKILYNYIYSIVIPRTYPPCINYFHERPNQPACSGKSTELNRFARGPFCFRVFDFLVLFGPINCPPLNNNNNKRNTESYKILRERCFFKIFFFRLI